MGAGDFATVANQYAVGDPTPKTGEQPILQCVEQSEEIRHRPSAGVCSQQRDGIADDPMAYRFAKNRREKIQHRRVRTPCPDEQNVGAPAGLQVSARHSEQMD